MEAFGPAQFGPLAPVNNGHGNDSGRAVFGLQNIFNKTGDISQVAQEAARNDLTHTQEFKWGDVFMHFTYQNRNGKWYSGGRELQELSDPTEIGGDRINRVIMAQDRMAADPSITEAIVVSEDLGYGRHFIYRYRRGENNDVEGLAFEFQGSTEELDTVVKTLGRDDTDDKDKEFSDFSKPLFFGKENQHDVNDLSKAVLGSFKTKERRNEMSPYLTRLERDTNNYDDLVRRRQIQEEELQNQYEKLILHDENAKTGIASAVYGMIKATEKMVASEDRIRDEFKKPDAVIPDSKNYARETADILRSLSYGLIAIPGLIDHTGRLIEQKDVIRTKSDSDDIIKNKKTQETDIQTSEQIIQQIIEPAVAGIIGFLPFVGSVPDEKLVDVDVKDRQHVFVLEGDDIISHQLDQLFAGSIGKTKDLSAEEILWQEFMAMIFTPVKEEKITDGERLVSKNIGSDRVEEEGEFLDIQKSFSDMLIRLIPIMNVDEIGESQDRERDVELKILKSEFRKGLEVIVELMGDDLRAEIDEKSKKETQKQIIVETAVVDLGKEILEVMFQNKDIQKLDNLAHLSFLYQVYNDEKSSPEIKHLLSALIYKQLQNLQKDEQLIKEYPQLASIFEKFHALSPEVKFLEVRFDRLISALKALYPIEFFNLHGEDGQDFMSKVIFLIVKLMQPEQFSIERLFQRNSPQSVNIFFPRHKTQKKQDDRIQYRILYRFDGEIIYQYCPTCHKLPVCDKIE